MLKSVWAGSWLIWSVRIELMTHRRSAIEPRWGKRSQMRSPLSPKDSKSKRGAKQRSSLPWSCAIGWPRVNDSGIGSPSMRRSAGFSSKVSRWLGPPAM